MICRDSGRIPWPATTAGRRGRIPRVFRRLLPSAALSQYRIFCVGLDECTFERICILRILHPPARRVASPSPGVRGGIWAVFRESAAETGRDRRTAAAAARGRYLRAVRDAPREGGVAAMDSAAANVLPSNPTILKKESPTMEFEGFRSGGDVAVCRLTDPFCSLGRIGIFVKISPRKSAAPGLTSALPGTARDRSCSSAAGRWIWSSLDGG
jgi:hypothetical protein